MSCVSQKSDLNLRHLILFYIHRQTSSQAKYHTSSFNRKPYTSIFKRQSVAFSSISHLQTHIRNECVATSAFKHLHSNLREDIPESSASRRVVEQSRGRQESTCTTLVLFHTGTFKSCFSQRWEKVCRTVWRRSGRQVLRTIAHFESANRQLAKAYPLLASALMKRPNILVTTVSYAVPLNESTTTSAISRASTVRSPSEIDASLHRSYLSRCELWQTLPFKVVASYKKKKLCSVVASRPPERKQHAQSYLTSEW